MGLGRNGSGGSGRSALANGGVLSSGGSGSSDPLICEIASTRHVSNLRKLLTSRVRHMGPWHLRWAHHPSFRNQNQGPDPPAF